jgi:tRNA G18 (ribose-2'-O)-methylase SpoU
MNSAFEIRVCGSCGLRYPLIQGQSFGARCPQCLGETSVVLTKEMSRQRRGNAGADKNEREIVVLLDNIRSAWNVGSILRSADGFGFSHAHLCGITPTPEIEAVRKTSLGAETTVEWTYHKNALEAAQELKLAGYKLLALEDDKKAVEIWKARVERKTALVVGNEISGVDPDLLSFCNEIVYIPMRGMKKSFNVSTAFGIAAYALAVEFNARDRV